MTELVGGGNAILLLLTGMALAGAAAVAFLAVRRKKHGVARTFTGGAAILALAYGGGVLAASAASREVTLAPGDTKWFCGFYLDCHLGLSVDRHETVAEVGAVKPAGQFHILTLGLHNSAKNPNVDMLLYHPEAKLVDASGRAYSRSAAAESALPRERPPLLGAETTVTHDSAQATIVFDLPVNAADTRLIVTEGWLVDRVIELGLIDDENSIFHRRTYQAIDIANPRIAAGVNR